MKLLAFNFSKIKIKFIGKIIHVKCTCIPSCIYDSEEVEYNMAAGGVYGSREVKWELDGIEMEGTVTWPLSQGSYAGVVIVAGSGPTDRNWCSPLLPGTNGSGKLIAEALTRAGFATMRYDKRPSGPHIQENVQNLMGHISMQTHVDELEKAVEAFVENTKVDPEKLYALTSSEGAIHALNYQIRGKQKKFQGFVLTGVPGRSVGDVAREQMTGQIGMLGDSEKLMDHYDKAISDFRAGKPYIPDPSIPDGMKMLLQSVTSPANLPFSRELFVTNPLDLIQEVPEPMLIIIGKKDIQVNWEADGKNLQESLGSRENLTIEFPDNANHVLKHEEKPRNELLPVNVAQMYNADNVELDQETVESILSWLKDRIS